MTTVAQRDDVVIRRREPGTRPSWVADGRAWGASHLAHAPEWPAVVHRAYGHVPLCVTAETSAGCVGVLPAIIVRRPWFGTIVTSMPFLDGGGPCSESADISRRLVERLLAEARGVDVDADVVEFRSADRLDIPCEPRQHKVNLFLPLPADPGELWKGFDGSVRNQVRKAERAGLTVEEGDATSLEKFYAIFATRMRDLGSPAHDVEFFRATLEAFGERARIVTIRKDGTAIGGLIAIAHQGTLTVPWASCLPEFFALCPNMLLYWHTIRAACLGGFRRFDFGRSTRGSGTYRFKSQWGATEQPLFWYTLPVGSRGRRLVEGREPVDEGHDSARHLVHMWRHLPVMLTRRVGPYFRKYLVQ